jgi:cytochrome c peroxidase
MFIKQASFKLLHLAKPRQLLRMRTFAATATAPPKQQRQEPTPSSSSSSSLLWLGLAVLAAGGGYYYYDQQQKPLDYQQVYNSIANKLDAAEYDDGSMGPILVRLAWHASGTYDKETKTGGSHGATMRYAPESDHGANAGLAVTRNFLEQFKKEFPKISYADLWSLAGVVAIQEMGGPTIKWRPGRGDLTADSVSPDGRLPDASKPQSHLRDIFYRMGFNDQEIVALSGAHVIINVLS